MPTVHLLIKGKVQGVYFRASAKEAALALDLQGWVKNTSDGSVEAVATGSESSIQQFVEWCKTGPAQAIVDSVNVTSVPEEEHSGFVIRRSAN